MASRLWTRALLVAPGLALFAAAARLDEPWWMRHVVVPACYLPPAAGLRVALRLGLGIAGLAITSLGLRLRARRPTAAGAARLLLAVALAFCAAELALRVMARPERFTPHPRLEFLLGRPDPRTGWSFLPGRVLRFGAPGGGPVVEYAVDAHGDRAPFAGWVEDPLAPTLLVAGESIAVGHGLAWKDTFAAQAGARLGLQVVNAAEGGYGSDQALLRARDALRRLRQPAALVSTVLPVQLRRNLNDARPHLELRGGALAPAVAFAPRILLRELLVNDLQVLPEWRLQASLALTRALLEATAREARVHGARPLFLVPLFGPEPALIGELLHGLPHVVVSLEPARIMPWDGHPDAQGAQQLADAVVAALRAPDAAMVR